MGWSQGWQLAGYQEIWVELLRKVKVEAFSAMAHCAGIAHGVDDGLDEAI